MGTKSAMASVLCILTVSAFGMDTSIPFINADCVHTQGITGHGVTIAVIDCGVDWSHHGLIGNLSPYGATIIGGSINGNRSRVFSADGVM